MHGRYTFTASDVADMKVYISSKGSDGSGGQYPDHVTTAQQKRNFRQFIKGNNFRVDGKDLLKDSEKYFGPDGKVLNCKSAKAALAKTESGEHVPIVIQASTQVVVPEEMLNEIWANYHVNKGHSGVVATREAISKDLYIKNCTQFVKDGINQCFTCCNQMGRKPQKKFKSPLQLFPTPDEPMSHFQIDLCGPFTRSSGDSLRQITFISASYVFKLHRSLWK